MHTVVMSSGLADPIVLGWTEQAYAFQTAARREFDKTLEHFRAARAHFEKGGDLRNALAQATDEGFALVEVGFYREAVTLLTSILVPIEAIGISRIASLARMNLGVSLARLGRLDDARNTLTKAIDGFAPGQVHRVLAINYLAITHRLAGRLDQAEQCLRAGLAAMPTPSLWDSRSTLAQVLLDQGRVQEALELVPEIQSPSVVLTSSEGGVSRQPLVRAEALWALGERQAALMEIQQAARALQTRSSQIADPETLKSYVYQVPDHARVMILKENWSSL
jgi:tetratricopeptide (TPR) repeat protein